MSAYVTYISCSRIIVHEAWHDEFQNSLIAYSLQLLIKVNLQIIFWL